MWLEWTTPQKILESKNYIYNVIIARDEIFNNFQLALKIKLLYILNSVSLDKRFLTPESLSFIINWIEVFALSHPGSNSALCQWAKQSQNKQSCVVCVHLCTLTQFSHAKLWVDLLFLLMSWMKFDVMN